MKSSRDDSTLTIIEGNTMILTILIITLTMYISTYVTGRVSSNMEVARPGMPSSIHYVATGFFLISTMMTIILLVAICHSVGIQINPRPIGL